METYLAHHGILGMKWGVRRYQNPDGTLTEAGRRRIASQRKLANVSERTARAAQMTARYNSALAQATKNKAVRQNAQRMSDDELKKTNARSALEQQYQKNHGLKNAGNGQSESTAETVLQGLGDAANALGKKYERIAEGETARKAKTLSDAELRSAVQRMQLEDQYRQLSKKDRDSGANYVYNHRREMLNDVVTYATPVATAIIIAAINKKIGG